jgi:tRNA-Thr(GGU) m(6)t(6)A37 methyltransferase TsaA
MEKEILALRPIGVIATPHQSKYGAPRQPASARERSVGVITLNAGENFEQALGDLEGFDYAWILFWFHRNSGWKPKVLPPHGGRTKRGLFSTRSPHRPNPIGLSLCRILKIRGRTLRIENPDMLDGTPILDIKPYLPHAESHPRARNGWIGEGNESTRPRYRVRMAPAAEEALSAVSPAEKRELLPYLDGLLSHDPHPHPYRRITLRPDGGSLLAVKRWRVAFTIKESTVTIRSIVHAKGGTRADG